MRWDDERLFFDGDAWFESLIEGIRGAVSSISLEFYIVDPDAVGKRVFAELACAAARGVEVRFLVDGVGSAAWLREFRDEILKSAVEVRIFHPLPLFVARLAFASRRGLQVAFRGLLALNRRTHRKLCIIDDRKIWLGSLNLSAVHSRALRGERAWRDTGAFIRGGACAELQAAFLNSWRRAWRFQGLPRFGKRLRAPAPSGLVLVNARRAERRRFHAELLGRIAMARQKVWITTAYFVPSGSLLRALKTAARSGADVRIIVPRVSDVPFMPWVSLAFYLSLLLSGVRVYEYERTILHAKSLVADDWCLVGSMNLNNRSLYRDLEICVSLVAECSRVELEAAFWRDLAASRAVSSGELAKRPRWQFWVARFFLLFKWML